MNKEMYNILCSKKLYVSLTFNYNNTFVMKYYSSNEKRTQTNSFIYIFVLVTHVSIVLGNSLKFDLSMRSIVYEFWYTLSCFFFNQ